MLGVLASLYRQFIDRRNRRFEDGDALAESLGARTISIGNITTGGTGKTPLVIKVAETLAARGKRVCILTRGYGRKDAKTRVVLTDGRGIFADPSLAGDEPVEMAIRLKGRAVIVADADRVAAAAWAKEEFGINVFVLDDAFQHRRAARDVNIVLIDATDPFGGGKLLPAGRLREPLEGLSRADAIVITRSDLADTAGLKTELAKYAPDAKIFTARSATRRLAEYSEYAGGDAKIDHASLANAKAWAFCGIGNPSTFFDALRRDNYELAGETSFRDHHVYTQRDIKKIVSAAKKAGAAFLLTTAKDAVKLRGMNLELPCYVVEISVAMDDQAAFEAML